ncbi:MAG: potassium/proton antiporter [Lentisphaeria bacterium]|nr:potassium/proton antiporter [Lentisphaeria bacterium]
MPDISVAFAAVAAMLLIGAFSNKLSSRFNVPILLIFLLVGMIIGREHVPEDLEFGRISVAGTVAMCFILFSGGLNTSFDRIRPVLIPGGALATVGVIATTLAFGGFAHLALRGRIDFTDALLLGAMISSTDAAAVFAILSGKKVGLKGRLRPLLEFESGSNDPMAYFLTLFMIDVVLGKGHLSFSTVGLLVYRTAAGVLMGIVAGVFARLLYKTRLEYEGLYFVFAIAAVLLSYGLAEGIGANGMMSCYVCGITMNHLGFNYQKGITRFSDGVSWLMQVILFTTLGIFVDVNSLPDISGWGLLLAGILLFIARPAAVFLTLPGDGFSLREKILISWVGLRGAAPIVLATFPLSCGVGGSRLYFNMIFFMVIVSMVVQGTTIMPLARLLKLDKPVADHERMPLELESTPESRGREMREFIVPDGADCVGRTIAELAFPPGVLVTLIRRDRQLIQPNGSTEVRAGDGLLIMGEPRRLAAVQEHYFPAEE